MMGARDITGAAGAGADAGRGLDHGADHFRMLAHAEIVVGAPDHDITATLRRVPDRMREAARDPFEVGENAVAPLVMRAVEGVAEKFAVIHHKTWNGTGRIGHPSFRIEPRLFRAFPALVSTRNATFERGSGMLPRRSKC